MTPPSTPVTQHKRQQSDARKKPRQSPPYVHIDQTPTSAVSRIYKHVSSTELPNLITQRFQIINLWRPLSIPATTHPLALCDFRSLEVETDVVPFSTEWGGETSVLKSWAFLRADRHMQCSSIGRLLEQAGLAQRSPQRRSGVRM